MRGSPKRKHEKGGYGGKDAHVKLGARAARLKSARTKHKAKGVLPPGKGPSMPFGGMKFGKGRGLAAERMA